MKKFLMAAVLAATSAAEAAPELHSTIKPEVEHVGNNLAFTLKTEPNEGLVINLEGPWKLELKNTDGLPLAKTTFARGELDEKNASFTFHTTAKTTKAEGEIEYKFIAFVCTKDKTTCYRDVHEGKVPWKSQASK